MSLLSYEELSPQEAMMVNAAFEAGNLSWLLESHQLAFYETIWSIITKQYGKPAKRDDVRATAFQACRRIGKSFCMILVAIEFAKRYPKTNILYTAPTASEARDVIEPLLLEIVGALPPNARPTYNSQRSVYTFANGTTLQIKGLDLHPHRLRGTNRDLVLVDEGAYVNKLRYILDGILGPMTFRTRGLTVVSSTRGLIAANEFNLLWAELRAIGQAAKLTVYEAGFPEEMIEAERRRVSPAIWRIEYECEDETDASMMIVPEWQAREPMVLQQNVLDFLAEARAWAVRVEEAKLLWRITAVDFGVSDNTVVLCGVFDFQNHTMIPLREWVTNGREVSAENIARAVRRLEAQVDELLDYNVTHNLLPLGLPGWIRVGDHDIPMLQTLAMDHGISILPVNKSSLENNVNYLRSFLTGSGEKEGLKLDPKHTPNLFACIRTGTWAEVSRGDSRRRIFARSGGTDGNGQPINHFDALAAAVYMASAARFLCNYEPTVANLGHTKGKIVPISQAHKYVSTGKPGDTLFQMRADNNSAGSNGASKLKIKRFE